MSVLKISEFTKKVLQNIKSIPKGRVATYKQIAILSGKPQGSRGVAWILHTCSTTYKLPWHRVINSQGKISFDPKSHNFKKQKKLLELEGVQFSSNEGLSLKIYQWNKKPSVKKTKKSEPKMFRS